MKENLLKRINVSDEIRKVLSESKGLVFPRSRAELIELAFGEDGADTFEVRYDIEGLGSVLEATVTRCKNGAAVNYTDDYMRRRDPDSLVIADDLPTDKPKFSDIYDTDFGDLRAATFEWLKTQKLIVMPFMAGGSAYGYDALLIAPANAAFFACALADLQGFIDIDKLHPSFDPKSIIFLAPTFRHTHLDGKQVVVHHRKPDMHELFAYNLYPGPSAKKGIYGVLLNIGEAEGWVTLHASTVKVITPYENEIIIMHEGASGSGKSEMLEHIHKEIDDRIVLGQNLVSGEKTYIELKEECQLRPITDDMAMCPPRLQNDSKKLVIKDAEDGWFLRIDHITHYGCDPHYEQACIHPPEPLIFLNIDGTPGSTCLIWEHTLNTTGEPCTNPRVILPRRHVSDIVSEPVEVDVRSFGVRTPPCFRFQPSYGIIGLFQILPPAVAWLWRLVAPRGHNNPSVTQTTGMGSEGVGSYWPFATGKMVTQANLLLDQILNTSSTRYVLIPNQHIGAYKVGFMPQWIAREYIARRGSAKFKPDQLKAARCPLFGYSLATLKLDGTFIPMAFLQPETQAEIGIEGYDKGAQLMTNFFKDELKKYLTPELNPLGRQIIEYCLRDATSDEYCDLIPMRY